MRVSPIQDSFASGEIDPRVQGRTTTDAYKNGLKRARNWRPQVQGPISLREGSKYVTPVDPTNWTSGQVGVEGLRCFTFQRMIDTDVIVEVGEGLVKVVGIADGEVIVGGVTDNLIPNPQYVGWDIIGQQPAPCLAISGVPNATWDCDRDFEILGSDNVGRYTAHVNFASGHAQVSPGCDTYNISGSYNAGTPDASVALRVQTGPKPGPFNTTDPVYTAGVTDGWYSPAWMNAVGAPIVIPAGSELLVNTFTIDWAMSMGQNQLDILGAFPLADIVLRVNIGSTRGASDVFTSDLPIADNATRKKTILNFTPGATNNNLYIQIFLHWQGAAIIPNLFYSDIIFHIYSMAVSFYPFTWTAPLSGGSGSDVEFASPYNVQQLECLQVAMDPGEREMFFMHPEVETMRLKFFDTGEWTFEALSAILLPTPYVPPSPDLWTTDNFPQSGAFHEGRLWLGGSPLNPATLWASRSGDYVDFGGAAPASADDPLLFPLASSGNIQSLTSRKELVINTDISEVIGTSEQGVIAFDDFSFPKQTDWGSNCIQPIVVGRDMIYTSNSRQKVRTFSDEGGTNYGWDGNELSLLARDIFGIPIRRMEYLDEPAYQACFLLTDGSMGMATFFYPENVIGWWRFNTAYNGNDAHGDVTRPGLGNQFPNTAQGINQIMDITKINTSQGARLWMLVNRVGFPGTLVPGHEVLTFDQDDILSRLDSCAFRIVDPVTLTISNIDFLTDQSVNVLVRVFDQSRIQDGPPQWTVHPNITVIAGVSSAFESWAAGQECYVGLFYNNDCQLLGLEGVSNRGTSQVSKRRWNKVFARLNNSAIPLIEGIHAKDRTPATPMGGGEPLVTGDVEIVDLGSGEGDISFTQDIPIRTEISAIFGKVTSTEV